MSVMKSVDITSPFCYADEILIIIVGCLSRKKGTQLEMRFGKRMMRINMERMVE